MSRARTHQEFVAIASKVHNSFYSYEEFTYTHSENKEPITCPVHGVFYQVVKKHVSGRGCRACAEAKASKRYTKTFENFLADCREVHGDTYTYKASSYVNSKSHITLACKIHGEFKQIAGTHLRGAGCKKCGSIKMGLQSRKSQEEFLSNCKEVHGDRYDYTKAEYLGDAKHVVIGCTNHGDFKSTPSNHLSGKGCPTCAIENGTTYNITLAERNKKDFLGLPSGVYVMSMYGLGKESIYKIGITKDLKRRLKDIAREIGHPPTLLYYAPSNLYDSIITEQGLHDALSEFSYTSPIKFGGYTECFSLPDETATDLIEYLTYTFGEDTEIHE